MTARHAQLSYTSYDAGHGAAGGWQIKQTTGTLSDDEARRLMTGMRTVLTPVKQLPDYPTPEQLAAAPRRLAYRDGCYWHTALAGVDSTGRPGNLFVHALLDHSPTAAPIDRPVERWCSEDWLIPYGPAAVSQAELPAVAPRLSGVITRDRCISFALDPQSWRLTTLLALLDAVAAAMAGGPPVLLGTESPDIAAHWIGAVSYLMAASTATALSFSTFDRAAQFDVASGFHLTAVPAADLETPPPGTVTIDGTVALVQLGQLDGQPHLTSTGQAIPATAWSALAQVVLLEDPDGAANVISELDGVAAAAGDTAVHPVWPLAVLVAADPRFADAAPEAYQVIAAHTPNNVAAGSAHATITAATVAHLCGNTTADAWRGLQQCTAASTATLAAQTYLLRAIADPGWLDQSGTIPAPAALSVGASVPPQLAAAVGPALDDASQHGPLRLVRLIDLLVRAGMSDSRFGAAVRSHTAALRHEDEGSILVRRLGPRIDTATRLIMAASLFGSTRHPIPAAVPVLDWLAAGQPTPTLADAIAAQPGDTVWTRAALAGARLLSVSRPAAIQDPLGLWWLRDCKQFPHFEDAAAARAWDPDDLLAAAGDIPLTARIVLPTLLGSPDTDGLHRLCDAILKAPLDEVAEAFATTRTHTPADWVAQGLADTLQPRLTRLWEQGLRAIVTERLDHSVRERLLCLSVIAAARRQPYPAVCSGWPAQPTVDDPVVDTVSAILIADPPERRQVLAAHLLGNDTEPGVDTRNADHRSAATPTDDFGSRNAEASDSGAHRDEDDPDERRESDSRRRRLRGRDKSNETSDRMRGRKPDPKREDAGPDRVSELLKQVVDRCAAVPGEAGDAEAIAALMSDMTTDTSEKAAKRYLRSATKLLAEHQKRPSLANRLRGNH